MSKNKQNSRRVTHNAPASRTWGPEGDCGIFSPDIDTARVRALVPDNLSVEHEPISPQPQKSNPYNSGARPAKGKTRRTLDDMRRLSEQIKQQRDSNGKPK